MRIGQRRSFTVGLASAALLASSALPAGAAPDHDKDHGKKANTVTVQLLGVNDFHGNLEPPTGRSGRVVVGKNTDGTDQTVDAGGAEYLATHIKRLQAARKQNYTAIVASGDLIGASPLLSAAFHDEPTIEFFNSLKMFASATGNHEYDEGIAELMRIQHGGCHPVDGCADGDGYDGADFTYLSANVTDAKGRLVMPAYAVRNFGNGIKVGIIGLPLQGTPLIVSPSGVAGLKFGDEVTAIDNASRQLTKRGVNAQIVVMHQGDSAGAPNPNACADNGASGPAKTIAAKINSAVDAVFTGHSHQQYNCVVNDPAGHPRPVIQGASFGRLISEIDLTIDKKSHDVVRDKTFATNHIVTRDVPKDTDTSALIAKYKGVVGPIQDRVIGSVASALTNTQTPAGDVGRESTMGNLIADSQLFASKSENAVAALMNPGGVRAGIDAGPVTYGEAFTVQPFGNNLTTMTLTGAQLDAVLEQQYSGSNATSNRVLSPSASLTYTASTSAAAGNKVSNIKINGVAITDAGSYRITVNSFLADGGDGFDVFKSGTNRVGGVVDLDALEQYLKATPNAPAPALDRITTAP